MYISINSETQRNLFSSVVKNMASDGLDSVRSVRETFSYWLQATEARCVFLKASIDKILALVRSISDVVTLADKEDRTDYPIWHDAASSSCELEQERIPQNLLKAEQEFTHLIHDCQTNPEPNFPSIKERLFTITQALENAIWSVTQLATYVVQLQEISRRQ